MLGLSTLGLHAVSAIGVAEVIGRGGNAAPFPFLGLLLAAGAATKRIRDAIMSDGVVVFKR